MKKSWIVFLVFTLVAGIHLAGQLLNAEIPSLATKPFIVPLIAFYYWLEAPFRSKVLLAGLFFGWLGDVLLMFANDGQGWFIGGLVAFLVGHVAYILSYRQLMWASADTGLLPVQKIRFSLPIVLVATGLITILYPAVGDLRVPVIVYALVIMLMTMFALFRYGRTTSYSFWAIFGGACLFLISDSVLALNKFLSPIHLGGFYVMATYIAAQALIVVGAIKHK